MGYFLRLAAVTAPLAAVSADENGLYQIAGTHSYAADGSYTVTITVADNSGGSASTTSTVDVGDFYAGIPATLKLGSFTAPDSSTTYTAIVAWGDGSSSDATVSEIAGVVTISGTHAYASSGSYQAQITVTPSNGSPATGDAPPVNVINAPITLYAANVGALAGSSSPVLVGTFTDPNPFDTASQFSASVYFGPLGASVTITGGNGLFSVFLAGNFGQLAIFAPVVDLAENGNLVAAEQPVPAAAPVVVQFASGPSIVPGNSIYWYFSPGVANTTNVVAWVSAAPNINPEEKVAANIASSRVAVWVDGDKGAIVQFGNVSQTVFVNYRFEVDGQARIWRAEVDIVQVTVAQAGNFEDLGAGNVSRTGPLTLKSTSDTFLFAAAVTLTAPKASDLSDVKVGFLQLATTVRLDALYVNRADQFARTFYTDQNGAMVQGRTFVDSIPAADPWYPQFDNSNPMANTAPANNTVVQPIVSGDAPGSGGLLRTLFFRRAGDWFAYKYALIGFNGVDRFQLNVAASLSSSGLQSGRFWSEANAAWATNFSFSYTPTGFGGTVSRDTDFGLTIPARWQIPAAPLQVQTDLPLWDDAKNGGEYRIRAG